MTRMTIDAATVAELGAGLAAVADELDGIALCAGDVLWAFGPGPASHSFEELTGNWQHERLVLGRSLRSLGAAAAEAGAAYLRVEDDLTGLLVGGLR